MTRITAPCDHNHAGGAGPGVDSRHGSTAARRHLRVALVPGPSGGDADDGRGDGAGHRDHGDDVRAGGSVPAPAPAVSRSRAADAGAGRIRARRRRDPSPRPDARGLAGAHRSLRRRGRLRRVGRVPRAGHARRDHHPCHDRLDQPVRRPRHPISSCGFVDRWSRRDDSFAGHPRRPVARRPGRRIRRSRRTIVRARPDGPRPGRGAARAGVPLSDAADDETPAGADASRVSRRDRFDAWPNRLRHRRGATRTRRLARSRAGGARRHHAARRRRDRAAARRRDDQPTARAGARRARRRSAPHDRVCRERGQPDGRARHLSDPGIRHA